MLPFHATTVRCPSAPCHLARYRNQPFLQAWGSSGQIELEKEFDFIPNSRKPFSERLFELGKEMEAGAANAQDVSLRLTWKEAL